MSWEPLKVVFYDQNQKRNVSECWYIARNVRHISGSGELELEVYTYPFRSGSIPFSFGDSGAAYEFIKRNDLNASVSKGFVQR